MSREGIEPADYLLADGGEVVSRIGNAGIYVSVSPVATGRISALSQSRRVAVLYNGRTSTLKVRTTGILAS